jgi:hypothetical protein
MTTLNVFQQDISILHSFILTVITKELMFCSEILSCLIWVLLSDVPKWRLKTCVAAKCIKFVTLKRPLALSGMFFCTQFRVIMPGAKKKHTERERERERRESCSWTNFRGEWAVHEISRGSHTTLKESLLILKSGAKFCNEKKHTNIGQRPIALEYNSALMGPEPTLRKHTSFQDITILTLNDGHVCRNM